MVVYILVDTHWGVREEYYGATQRNLSHHFALRLWLESGKEEKALRSTVTIEHIWWDNARLTEAREHVVRASANINPILRNNTTTCAQHTPHVPTALLGEYVTCRISFGLSSCSYIYAQLSQSEHVRLRPLEKRNKAWMFKLAYGRFSALCVKINVQTAA